MRAKSNTKWRADFDYFWKPRSIENQVCSMLSDCQYLGRIAGVMIKDIEALAMGERFRNDLSRGFLAGEVAGTTGC